ncbi:MAG: hypothetical protein H6714_10080 [Myxococcales bacterium]|nr:hypothetical protein [Myxococcales bacterium]
MMAGCPESRDQLDVYPLIFHAQEPNGAAVSGVAITLNTRRAGSTDAEGRLRVSMRGKEGALVNVQAECPLGFTHPRDLQPIVLRKILKFSQKPHSQAVEIAIPCKPSMMKTVVIVRADGQASMPVFIDGREVARTNTRGVAHLVVRMAPGTEFQVKIGTGHKPRLRPQDPSQTFVIPEVEGAVVFDQAFVMAERHRRSKRKSRSKSSSGPIRLN